ncbi:putative transmembrane protein [Dioscorea sansibarensis]
MDPSSDPFLSGAGDSSSSATSSADHGWQKVSYAKRQRRPNPAPAAADHRPNGVPSNVFASVERSAFERRKAIEAATEEYATVPSRSRPGPAAAAVDSDEDDDSAGEGEKENRAVEGEKKIKQKKPKKPKVSVAEAASKIDAANLAVFLADVSVSYESQPEIQLLRFADYFGRAFASVSESTFPTKMFKESPISKIDIPVSHIPDAVYKTSVDWIAQKPVEALGFFVLCCLDIIYACLASKSVPAKGSKKSAAQPSKPLVAIFAGLAMTIRRKPDVLVTITPKLRENSRYQGQEMLPIIIWCIGQASLGDVVIGMYLWSHFLLPSICGKSNVNPQFRDWVLQLVERILSGPKARSILLNGAVRKGERLFPPSALDLLMRSAFPAPSARVKATDRFTAVYPTLKQLALAGSPGTKTTKQASQQLLPYTIKAMQGDNPELTKEATDVFFWCLTQNAECYKQWEKLYLENVSGSVAVLRKLSDEWKESSVKLSPLDHLKETLNHLRAKNEEALSGSLDANSQASVKEADKYCNMILRRLERGCSCGKGAVLVLTVAIASAAFVNWNEPPEVLSSFLEATSKFFQP